MCLFTIWKIYKSLKTKKDEKKKKKVHRTKLVSPTYVITYLSIIDYCYYD